MSVAGNEQLVRRYFEQVDADFYAEDAHLRDMSQAHTLRGREAIRAFLFMYLEEAFPEGGYEVQNVIASENAAVAEWTFRGVNTGPLMGVPPTHRNVEFSGVSVYEIEKGLFTAARVYYDTGALADQLGLLGQRLPRSERDQWQDWWKGKVTE